MIRVGLTGTLGAGKSTLGRLFEAWGAVRIDADELAREAVRPGSPALGAIASAFGQDVLDAMGGLDRAAIRRRVSRDPGDRERLESIVHPEVRALRARRVAEAEAAGATIVVEEIPLLFETGIEADYAVIVVVDATLEIRRARVIHSRGITEDEFRALDGAQLDGAEKRRRADHVVDNSGGPEALEAAARELWREWTGGDPVRWAIDLHMHTDHSYDCMSDPRDVARTARAAGLDRIAVTDHNEIDGARAAREADPELVIVGEEVRTSEGLDLIGLFIGERIPRGGEFTEVAAAIREQGGIVYLPHPFDSFRGSDEEFLAGVVEWIDCVEGFNARVHDQRRNLRAQEWARRHGLPIGAGSDAHLLREIGRGRVLVPPFEGREGFLPSLAHGELAGRPSGHWVHAGSTWAKLWNRVTGGSS